MMQGPPMISHPQSLPPLHHPQMHNLPPTTFMTSIPSAHAVAPLHQIHPQQVILWDHIYFHICFNSDTIVKKLNPLITDVGTQCCCCTHSDDPYGIPTPHHGDPCSTSSSIQWCNRKTIPTTSTASIFWGKHTELWWNDYSCVWKRKRKLRLQWKTKWLRTWTKVTIMMNLVCTNLYLTMKSWDFE